MKSQLLYGAAAFGGLLLIGLLVTGDDASTEPTMEPAEATEERVNELPPEFAERFPIYPNATVANMRVSATEQSQDVSLSLNTGTSVPEVYEWYENALSSNGWAIKSDRNVAGYRIIQAERENLYTSLQVTSGSEPDTASISQQLKVRTQGDEAE